MKKLEKFANELAKAGFPEFITKTIFHGENVLMTLEDLEYMKDEIEKAISLYEQKFIL